MAQLVQLLSPITARLDAMERRELSPAPQTHTPETQPDPTTYLERSQKKRLPDPERFDGDRSNYPGWKYECEGKLEYDSHLYPSQDAKKRYILSRTKEKATQVLLPWLLENQLSTVKELWEHLDTQFLDVHRQKRAPNKLRHLKQGRRLVRDYVSEFNQLRVEAGQDFSKSVLREMFSEGLSVELQRLMLRTPKNISFKEYTEEAIEISDDLYRINLNSRSQERTSQRAHGISHQKDTRTPSPPEKMDWEPTKAGKASTRTSRSSVDQVKCYACGEKGHISKYCGRSSKASSTK
ncbi:hypothetical protein PTT_15071, partial [Pyrenophora teres f. teres 0-1]